MALRLNARFDADARPLVQATGQARDALGRLTGPTRQVAGAADAATRSTAAWGRALGSLSGLIAGVSITALARDTLQAGFAFAATEARFRTAAGGVAAGAAAMASAGEIAQRLGLDLAAAERGFSGLLAAARGTALESEARALFEGVATAATALQLPAEQLQGALTAVEQIISKGRVSAEELRQQLGERLPGAFQIAARAMGVTTTELDDMLQAGELLSEDFLPRFARQLETEFGGAAADAAGSATAELNRFRNAILDIQREITQGGLLDGLTEGLRGATEALRDPGTLEAMRAFGATLGDGLQLAAENAGDLAQAIGGVVALRFAATLIGWGRAAATAAASMGLLRGVIGAFGGPLGLLTAGVAALPFLIETNAERAAELGRALGAARGAMEGFAAASRKAGDDQERLGGQVSLATRKILEQSRAQLQTALADLRRDLQDTLQAFDGGRVSRAISRIAIAGIRNRSAAEPDFNVPIVEVLADPAAQLGGVFGSLLADFDALAAGANERLPEIAARFERVAGAGDEAAQAAGNFLTALRDVPDGPIFDAAAEDLLRVATAVGGLEQNLAAVAAAQDAAARSAALEALARRLQDMASAGEILRDVLGQGLLDALRKAGAGQETIDRMQRALDGTLDLTEELGTAAGDVDFSGGAASAGAMASELGRAAAALEKLQKGLDGLSLDTVGLRARLAALQGGAGADAARLEGELAEARASVGALLAQNPARGPGGDLSQGLSADVVLQLRERQLREQLDLQREIGRLEDALRPAGGGGTGREEISLTTKVVEEFGQRFGNTFDVAAAQIEAWRVKTQAELAAAGQAHTGLAEMVDQIARDRLADAYEEDLQNRDDWRAGVERGLREVAGAHLSMADIAEEAVTTAFRSMEDAFVSLATTGKVETQDLVDFALRQVFRLATAFASGQIGGAGGGGLLGNFFGGLFGLGATTQASTAAAGLPGLFNGAGNIALPVFHSGGQVGLAPARRIAPAALFADAPRLHLGGLLPGERPAILLEDERVLTAAQQRATAETIRGLSRPGETAPRQPLVNVNIVGAGREPQSVTARSSGDTLDIDVIFEEFEARLGRNTSEGRGLAPAIAGRFALRPDRG